MYVVESFDKKTNQWQFVFAHEDITEVDNQFRLCCSQFPQGTYRTIAILTFRPRTEDENGNPVIG